MSQLIEQAFQHHQNGRFDQASLIYETILKSHPENERVLFLLGTLRCQQRQFEEAISFLNRAIKFKPKMFEAYNSLGNAYMGLNQFDLAEKAYRKAHEGKISSAANNLEILWLQIGNEMKSQGDFKSAEDYYRKAHELHPQSVLPLNNLAVVLKDQNRLEESLECYRQLIDRGVNAPEVLMNCGLTLKEMGKFPESLRCYDEALKFQPDNAEAHYNRARLLIQTHHFEEGFKEFEWRLKLPGYAFARNYIQKKWAGENLSDKSIVIFGEQGIGDELEWASCLQAVINQSRECSIECHPKLLKLFNRSFPKAKVSPRNLDGKSSEISQNKNIDFQSPIASLRQFLDPQLISSKFIEVDSAKSKLWKDRLVQMSAKKKVGVSWKTKALDLDNSLRTKTTTQLNLWGDVLKNKNYDFINLQYGDVHSDKEFVQKEFGTVIHDWDDIDLFDDLDSVAALISNLDLVISISSAVSALAGAVGVPVWVMTPYSLVKQPGRDEQSLWLPSVKHFVQPQPGDWESLFNKIGNQILISII